MFAIRPFSRFRPARHSRFVSTLPDHPDIYVHPTSNTNVHILSLLPTSTESISLGTTTALPPTPRTFTDNPYFLPVLHRILAIHTPDDPIVQSDALVFGSPGGASLISPHYTGAGAANVQGGAGGAGIGGYLHVYDMRGVPVFGRIAETEDIFGSVWVDGTGKVVRGSWEPNRSYRIITGQGGLIRLSEYLSEKVREGLKEEEKSIRS